MATNERETRRSEHHSQIYSTYERQAATGRIYLEITKTGAGAEGERVQKQPICQCLCSFPDTKYETQNLSDNPKLVCIGDGVRGTELLWSSCRRQSVREFLPVVGSGDPQLYRLLVANGPRGQKMAPVSINGH